MQSLLYMFMILILRKRLDGHSQVSL